MLMHGRPNSGYTSRHHSRHPPSPPLPATLSLRLIHRNAIHHCPNSGQLQPSTHRPPDHLHPCRPGTPPRPPPPPMRCAAAGWLRHTQHHHALPYIQERRCSTPGVLSACRPAQASAGQHMPAMGVQAAGSPPRRHCWCLDQICWHSAARTAPTCRAAQAGAGLRWAALGGTGRHWAALGGTGRRWAARGTRHHPGICCAAMVLAHRVHRRPSCLACRRQLQGPS